MATTVRWLHPDGVSAEVFPSGAANAIGFYGSAFGQSVRVGEYQDSTEVTDANGAAESGSLKNNKYISSTEVKVDAGSNENISGMACNDVTLMIQFDNTSAVQLQNTSFRAYDRVSIANPQSGVTVQAYEAASSASGSLSGNDTAANAFGDTTWTQISGATALSLIEQSGSATTHYHYIGMAGSPTQIGQKTDLGYYYETEFL